MMNEPAYSRFDEKTLILRDELAIDRTRLANERTLLAYLRSGVALVIAGVSIMHFAARDWFWVTGLVCIPSGLIATLIGIVRYRKVNEVILAIRKKTEAE